MHRRSGTHDRAARNEVLTAAAGLLLVGAVLGYQLWDFRAAFSDFEKWWVFIGPSFAGDDYIAATGDAEQVGDYHIYYRSIAVATAARRVAGGRPEEIQAPVQLHLLWSDDPDEPGDFANPAFRDTALLGWSSRSLEWIEYDPMIDDSIIAAWRADGRVEDLKWNVAVVQPDSAEDSFVLFTDERREIVYVAPLSLASGMGGIR